MKYKLYTTSKKAWDAMFDSIDQAKKSICIEMYIFLDDTATSHDFIGRLKQKALEGVHVVIVADAFGSKGLKVEVIHVLQNAGVEFIFFSHWLRHIHRKVLIVDKKIAFIGGVNIGKRFMDWHDLQLKLHGRIVKRILKSFAYTYEMAGGKDLKILNYGKSKATAKLKFWLVENFPVRNIYSLKSHYVEKITKAQKNIQIVTPYFTPPRWLISLLDDAVRRGVRVEIFIPREVDWRIMNRINHRYMYVMSGLGVKFYLAKNMNHAKLLIIDGEEGILGSQNVDLLSFGINSELGLFFRDKKLLRELADVVRGWKNDSIEFKAHHYKMKLGDYVILSLMKILHPIL